MSEKYTIAWYGSTEIEADSADEAAEKFWELAACMNAGDLADGSLQPSDPETKAEMEASRARLFPLSSKSTEAANG
jgi:hypothetical protein